MNAEDYAVWEAHFCKVFPEMRDWLGKQDQETRAAWRESLDDVPLGDAMEASKRIHRGDGPQIPGPSKYPMAIRACWHDLKDERAAEAKRPSAGRWKDGIETYRCHLCRDEHAPVVVVLRPGAVKQAASGTPWNEIRSSTGRVNITTVAVACSCDRGVAYADATATKRGRMFVYDPGRMFAMPPNWKPSEPPDGFAEWLEQYTTLKAKRMPNYEPAFAAFEQPEELF